MKKKLNYQNGSTRNQNQNLNASTTISNYIYEEDDEEDNYPFSRNSRNGRNNNNNNKKNSGKTSNNLNKTSRYIEKSSYHWQPYYYISLTFIILSTFDEGVPPFVGTYFSLRKICNQL